MSLAPADIDWNQPWHTILHSWHNRIDQQLEYHGFKIWSAKYLSEYWKFANYVALLDENRSVKRILHWNAGGGRPGRSFFQWQTPMQKFLPLASVGRLASYCAKHRSLVPVLRGLCFLCSAMTMLFSFPHV